MSKGVDVRATTSELLFRALLQSSSGTLVTSGTTLLYLYEIVMSDGTLKSYDFNDNTFKTTALTTETLAMTHRQGNNNTTNTGIWTARLATLSGFTKGNIYLARVNNALASPQDQVREFQFGGLEGDFTGQANDQGTEWMFVDPFKVDWSISGTTQTVKKPDDTTTSYTKSLTATPGANPITGAT